MNFSLPHLPRLWRGQRSRLVKAHKIALAAAMFSAAAALSSCGGAGSFLVNGLPSSRDSTPTAPAAPFTTAVTATMTAYYEEAQWGITAIGADWAHWSQHSHCAASATDCAPGYFRGAGVLVAVMDDGLFMQHPEFAGQVTLPTLGMPPNYDPAPLTLSHDHGTHVAGIIAARLDNGGGGVVGVAPEAKILPLRFLESTDYAMEDLFDYAAANTAFVINNSWGRVWSEMHIKYSGPAYQYFYNADETTVTFYTQVTLNAVDVWVDFPDNPEAGHPSVLASIRDSKNGRSDFLESAYNYSNGGGMMVWSAGNDGWNGDTGEVWAVAGKYGNSGTLFYGLPATQLATLTTSRSLHPNPSPYYDYDFGFLPEYEDGQVYTMSAGVNFSSILPYAASTLMPGHASVFAGKWINVVATDSDNKIVYFSNGCGATKDYCLAAPGLRITSATGTMGIRRASGTSQAAPHVTGAAALLKGAFPNLTAPQVVQLLLQNATDLGEPGVDYVYGHGLLNVSASFQPQGALGATAASSAVARFESSPAKSPLAGSRIQLSPAFAGVSALSSAAFAVGALDDYGRVYAAWMDFDNGILIASPNVSGGGIDGGAVHAHYAAPLSAAQFLPPAPDSYMEAESIFYEPQDGLEYQLHLRGDYARQRALLRRGNSQLGFEIAHGGAGWTSSAADEAADDFWRAPFADAAAAKQRLTFGHRLTSTKEGDAGVGLMAARGGGVMQAAARVSFNRDALRLHAEGGAAHEEEKMLGAEFSGVFEVKESETAYGRLSGIYNIGAARAYADYARAETRARTGGILHRLRAEADSYTAGLLFDQWRLELLRPFGVRGGEMDLRYVSGYDSGGGYATDGMRIDLSAASTKVLRLIKTANWGGARYALGADYLRRAPDRNGKNDILLSAAVKFDF